jgi:small subunit ribosomal protein S6e
VRSIPFQFALSVHDSVQMKLNIANPATGRQKLIDIDDEKKLRIFYDKRISQEVEGDSLGEEFKGYIFRITGGMDKEGFAMKQGVLTNQRVRLLLDGRTGHYRPRRDGARKRKSVRGAIVGPDLSVINLIIVKKGPKDLPGMPDDPLPKRLGPKRANKIRKLYGLTKDDDVRGYVVRRELPAKEGKPKRFKAPKIQRLITPERLQRKRRHLLLKRKRYEKNVRERAEYNKVIAQLRRERRQSILSRRAKLSAEKSKEVAKTSSKKEAPATSSTKKDSTTAKKKTKEPKKETAATPAAKK